MSIKALNWAWEIQTGSAIEKLVLMCYADYSDDLGKCWPAHETVARKCGISRKTVYRHLLRLADQGALIIRKRPGTSHEVTLNFEYLGAKIEPEIEPETAVKLSTGQDSLTRGSGLSDMGTQDNLSRGQDTQVSRGSGHPGVPRSTINHQKILARAREADDDDLIALGRECEIPPLPYETAAGYRARMVETLSRREQRAQEGASA